MPNLSLHLTGRAERLWLCPEIEDNLAGEDIHDGEFTTKYAVILGSAMGWAYEEGMEEAERRKLEKKMDADLDNRNR